MKMFVISWYNRETHRYEEEFYLNFSAAVGRYEMLLTIFDDDPDLDAELNTRYLDTTT